MYELAETLVVCVFLLDKDDEATKRHHQASARAMISARRMPWSLLIGLHFMLFTFIE